MRTKPRGDPAPERPGQHARAARGLEADILAQGARGAYAIAETNTQFSAALIMSPSLVLCCGVVRSERLTFRPDRQSVRRKQVPQDGDPSGLPGRGEWRRCQGGATLPRHAGVETGDAGRLDPQNAADALRHHQDFLHKHDKLGHPLYFEKIGSINIPQLRKVGVTQETLFKHYLFAMEFTIKYAAHQICPCDACVASKTQKMCIVLDARGIGMRDMGGEAFEFIRRCTGVMQRHYPQRSFKIFIVNVPSWFGIAWKGVKPLLNEATRAKTNILTESETASALLEFIDAENLPTEYGGTCSCAGGCEKNSSYQRLQRALVQSVLESKPFESEELVRTISLERPAANQSVSDDDSTTDSQSSPVPTRSSRGSIKRESSSTVLDQLLRVGLVRSPGRSNSLVLELDEVTKRSKPFSNGCAAVEISTFAFVIRRQDGANEGPLRSTRGHANAPHAYVLAEVPREELNQYWYSADTVATLAREAIVETPECGGRIAFLSTPSVYFAVKSQQGDSSNQHECFLLDFDPKFSSEGDHFVPYDFHKSQDVPSELRGTFDFVVVDPPFITREVWELYAESIKLLLRCKDSKILLTTIGNHDLLKAVELPGLNLLRICRRERDDDSRAYALYTNYESPALDAVNPEVDFD
ncbi:hypothetical protein ON010_g10458 [Phytophthora cinnamomi]|nr:hypothetical protein ON010_g10458 [Phytophthora cinnamomi]